MKNGESLTKTPWSRFTMNWDRHSLHPPIMTGSLVIAVAALPYSVKLCHLGIFLLTLNWLLEGSWQKKWFDLRSNLWVGGFVLLFILTLIGVSYSSDVPNGWFQVEKKFTFALVPLVLASSPKLGRKQIDLLLNLFVATCLIGTIICLMVASNRWFAASGGPLLNFDYFNAFSYEQQNPGASRGWLYFSYLELSSGIGIHPTYFSIYLLFCVAILVFDWRPATPGLRIFRFVLIVYLISFVALLSTRLALFAAVIITLFFLANELRADFTWRVLLGALTLLTILVTMTALNPVSRFRSLEELQVTSFDILPRQYVNSTEIRYALWWTGLRAAEDVNPVVGAGSGSVADRMDAIAKQYGVTNILGSRDPHNQFVFTWIALGVIGFVVTLYCILFPARAAFKANDRVTIAFILLIGLACLTESFLELQKGIVFFILFQSLLQIRKREDVHSVIAR